MTVPPPPSAPGHHAAANLPPDADAASLAGTHQPAQPITAHADPESPDSHLYRVRLFRQRHARNPRVLHVGNIANNAYLNARILNLAGFDCDVICYDYYHIMGCPEWEDADFRGDVRDHFYPDWDSVDLRGFHRPPWFAQGPLDPCIRYLCARRQGDDKLTRSLWAALERRRRDARPRRRIVRRAAHKAVAILARAKSPLRRAATSLARAAVALRDPRCGQSLPARARYVARRALFVILTALRALLDRLAATLRLPQAYRRTRCAVFPSRQPAPDRPAPPILRFVLFPPLAFLIAVRSVGRALRWCLASIEPPRAQTPARTTAPDDDAQPSPFADFPPDLRDHLHNTIAAFRDAFPDRPDHLSPDDLANYLSVLPAWRQLLQHYDAVIAYATDGLFPLLCDTRPYLAFEHGTIRNIPFQNSPQGRLCAAAYRFADVALITNCDNIKAATELKLDNFRFVPHPVNEQPASADASRDLRQNICRKIDADFIVFHPSRQHWEPRRHPDWEKGNDILIRGFADFVHTASPRAAAVFVEWGQKVDDSKRLLQQLGVADRVIWIPPQPNRRMVQYVQAADAVADQFFLGAFGSLTPKALLHRCPVLLRLDEDRHRWCFPDLPPVLNVSTPEEVCLALTRLARDPDYRRRLADDGFAWYQRYHSNRVIASVLAHAILDAVERYATS